MPRWYEARRLIRSSQDRVPSQSAGPRLARLPYLAGLSLWLKEISAENSGRLSRSLAKLSYASQPHVVGASTST